MTRRSWWAGWFALFLLAASLASGATQDAITDSRGNPSALGVSGAETRRLTVDDATNGLLTAASTSYAIEVQRGNVSGASVVHKFGRNDGVPNGSWEFVSLLSTTTAYLSAATAVRVKAGGNAADDAAGAGAREITIVGIDATLDEVSESVATAGALASSATTATFWRVYRVFVSASGTYGAGNTAAITVENAAGGTDLITVAAGEGQSQYGGYSIPTGKTGYLLSVAVTVDASKTADVRMFQRAALTTTAAPVSAPRVKFFWDGIVGAFTFKPQTSLPAIPALSDVWFEARGSGASTEVSVDFEIALYDD